MPQHCHRYSQSLSRFRLTAVATLCALASACSTINPYLNPAPLSPSVTKVPACEGMTASPCDSVRRFQQTQEAVLTLQMQAHKSYSERASIKSLSSALSFPLAAVMLYQGAAHGGEEAVRNRLLKGGLGIAAAYEARNALLAGSPESVYLLSEARLICVASESSEYRVDLPAGAAQTACNTAASALTEEAETLKSSVEVDQDKKPARDALIAKAAEAVDAYYGAVGKLDAGAIQMRLAALKIVTDTNAALNTSSTSFNQALGLMKSEMATFAPATPTAPTPPGGAKGNIPPARAAEIKQMNKLAASINSFARSCVRPQPVVSGFDGCTTYSPAAPLPPTVSTTLPGNKLTMQPEEQKSFVITSTPSGTPWATWPGNDAGVAAMAAPQLITLSPTQTQVTLHYKTAVAAETKLQLVLTTLGVAGNATTVNITLKPKAGAAATAGAVGLGAANQAGFVWAPYTGDPDLVDALEYKASPIVLATFEEALFARWRTLCPGITEPTVDALMTPEFVKAVKTKSKTPAPTAAYCQPAAA